MNRVIDIVVNLWTKDVTQNYTPALDEFWRLVKVEEQTHAGIPLEEQIRRMDAAGIEKGLLIATTGGEVGSSIFFEKPAELIAEVVTRHPQRFKGVIGINPSRIMTWLGKLERAVREFGFVGAHLYPHWFKRRPDDRSYYPFYAKCAELGVPVQIQVGHSAQRFLPTVAHPMALDRIAIDFPELKIIGIHIGYPWTEAMISVAWKHPNVFIGSDAHAPRYWDTSFVRFINGRGQDKVLFGTDWPIVDFERAMREIEALELRETAKRKFLFENAVRVYELEDWV
ncbi:MAG: amidohydrolase [Pyrinomonas sp.]|uniref:amidohydrolase family protein n=1 Tax=Pyrinomonas sp. TaxID=2080306 RepID=UPI0033189281